MNKIKKALAITFPSILVIGTLTSMTGTLVSCSKNSTDVTQNLDVDIPLNLDEINSFGTILNSKLTNITIEQFNSYFVGDQAVDNINVVAGKLGISEYANDIKSIVAIGEYNSASIIITISNNCNFILNNNQTDIETNISYKISDEKRSLIFNNVVFAQYATITQLANDIDLSTQFATTVGSSIQETNLVNATTDGVFINSNDFNIDFTIPSSNPYFNIALPKNVKGVFDVDGLFIDNAIIDWTISDVNSNIKIKNENGKQLLYNTQALLLENSIDSIEIIGIIKNVDGSQIGNNVNLTFNFSYDPLLVLNPTSLLNSFLLQNSNSQSEYFSCSTNVNEINLNFESNVNSKEQPIPPKYTLNMLIGFFSIHGGGYGNGFINALVNSLKDFVNLDKIGGIVSDVPVLTNVEGSSDEEPDFSSWAFDWKPEDGPVISKNFPIVYGNTTYKLNWNFTITSNDNSFKPLNVKFKVNLILN